MLAIQPLPDFLSGYHDLDLHTESGSLVALDESLRITWVNEGWANFAGENGGHDVVARFGPGSLYLDGINGDLREHYGVVFRRALEDGAPHESLYECSSAEVFRLFRLRALPFVRRGLLLEHTLVEQRAHDHEGPTQPDASAFGSDRGLITQCGNCRRTRHLGDGSWRWVPAWITAPPLTVTHGVCAVCLGYYYGHVLRKKEP